MKKILLSNSALAVGILGMSASVAGTFAVGGSLLQKCLFLGGACGLLFSAVVNRQTMFVALQGVILTGAILGFFGTVPVEWKYGIMAVPVVCAFAYLIWVKYFQKDLWGILGSLGLIFIALGFAINVVDYPWLFNLFLALGGLTVAIYSGIGFFYYRIRITVLWLILNVVFSVKPLWVLIAA